IALHRGADQSDHRRRHRFLCHARRRSYRRARLVDRLCRRARHRADHPREIAGRLPARRISPGPWHGGHGRASARTASDPGAALPHPDQVARDRDRAEARAARWRTGPDRIGPGNGAGRAARVNAPSARPKASLGDTIARLSALHPKRIDLNLDRMHRVLERLGNPERKLPPVIHVAGTNGKGSTVAYLRAILETAGLRVHVYTSPWLVRINECFRLGGVLAGDDELRAALEHCEQANAGEPLTFFEAKTAAGFLLFAQQPADVLLLEVGLGGRLDSTNVVETPLASVIAPVSMDHMEFLGNTLTSIAAEKAAIIKRGVPVISAEQAPEVMAVIEQQARRMRAPLHAAGQQWHVGVERGRLVYQDERGLMDLAAPKLFGRHQFGNAGLAIATLRAIDSLNLGHAAYEGIVKAEWPARM